MEEIFIYCNVCNNKVKAIVLTKHPKDENSKKRYGMVRVLQHNIGFRKSCTNISQVKVLVESENKDKNGVLI
jgi:hypothetical protein